MNKKTIFWVLGIAIVALVVVAILKNKNQDESRVNVVNPEKRTLVETVVANGRIQPETEVIISSEVSGKILELPFREGAKVKKGDLLVRINPDLSQAALDRAEAALNNAKANKASADARLLQAEAQFKNSKLTKDRNDRLYEDGAISKAEYDNVEAQFANSEAEVMAAKESVKAATYSIRSAEASVKEARDSYSRTTIYAPMDGTISSLSVEEGEQVVGAMQMTGTEIMRVANLDVMEVLADVNESDIVRVAYNDTASIEVDAYIDRKFKGLVTEIANSATSIGLSADQVTNFEVKIRILPFSYQDLIENSRSGMAPFRPGMNATVDITTSTKSNAISVPLSSVTSRADTTSAERSSVERLVGKKADIDQEPVTCVFVVENEKVRLVPVETGVQDDQFIEIRSGLTEDMNVVSGPFDLVTQTLVPGDKVKVVSKDELYKKD